MSEKDVLQKTSAFKKEIKKLKLLYPKDIQEEMDRKIKVNDRRHGRSWYI